jgi:hypothetical protein
MEVQGNKALGGDGGGRFDEVAFIDVEVGVEDGRIHDYGACQGANRKRPPPRKKGAQAPRYLEILDI